jgi:hypothetical protein
VRFAERLVTDTSAFVVRNCDASSTRRYGAPMSVAGSRPFSRTRSRPRVRIGCHADQSRPAAEGRRTPLCGNTSASAERRPRHEPIDNLA